MKKLLEWECFGYKFIAYEDEKGEIWIEWYPIIKVDED